jgi:hypothetical protein
LNMADCLRESPEVYFCRTISTLIVRVLIFIILSQNLDISVIQQG